MLEKEEEKGEKKNTTLSVTLVKEKKKRASISIKLSSRFITSYKHMYRKRVEYSQPPKD